MIQTSAVPVGLWGSHHIRAGAEEQGLLQGLCREPGLHKHPGDTGANLFFPGATGGHWVKHKKAIEVAHTHPDPHLARSTDGFVTVSAQAERKMALKIETAPKRAAHGAEEEGGGWRVSNTTNHTAAFLRVL